MYHLNPAFEFACQPPNRLLFAGPGGEFVIVDTSGLIKRVLDAVRADDPLEPIFAVFEDVDQRTLAQDRVLGVLSERGIVQVASSIDKGRARAGRRDVFCDWLGFFGATAPTPQICVSGDATLAELVSAELVGLGLAVSRDDTVMPTPDGVAVFCQDKPDRAGLRAANALAVEHQSTFFPITLDRHIITLGPFTVPGATACVECLHHRDTMNRTKPDGEVGKYLTPAPSPFTARLAALLGVQTLSRFLFGAVQDMHLASVTRHSVLTGKSVASVVLKLPRCPVCCGPQLRKPLVSAFSVSDRAVVQAAE